MRIAVIGAGRIGGNIARQLARAGHEVTVSFARDTAALQVLADEIGGRVAAPAEAVAAAEVVIDTTNQFGSGPKPGPGTTAAAFNAARMPGARYTKCFNTLTSGFQARVAHREPRVVQWLCGDAEEAKAIVAALVRDAGYEPVDLGGTAGCAVMEAPRRPGAVYGEEHRPSDTAAVVAAVRAGRPIPPASVYDDAG